jgi:hypothetical protein
LGLVALSAACGTKTDATGTASIQSLTIAKGSNAFGVTLSGSFDVSFDLGGYAGSPIKITALNLRVTRGGATILPTVTFAATASSPGLPLTITPGAHTTLHYTLNEQHADADAATICAGPITVEGSAQEDATTTQLPIFAMSVTPSGC